jgi:hypothetical protein
MRNLAGIFSTVNRFRILAGGVLVAVLLSGTGLMAQNPLQGRFGGVGGGSGQKGADTLEHRKTDTITIHFRYLDSSRLNNLDSGILDFGTKIPRPDNWINLGNLGTPARDLAFSPRMLSGFDPGFHSFDIYEYTVDGARFYNTTKAYTELGYLLGSKAEQYVSVFHTQNIRPNWNAAFQYRLINSPGTLPNCNTSDNTMRFTSWYQSRNKRYQNFLIFVNNSLKAAENGGVQYESLLDTTKYKNQQTLPVNLGNGLIPNNGSPFGAAITTGTRYSTMTIEFRQQYDLGQKDSIVTDTSVIPLFYPRVRLEHTFNFTTHNYQFLDYSLAPGLAAGNSGYSLNSAYYARYGLGYVGQPQIGVGVLADTFHRIDNWHVLANDFSIYQFPDARNPQQFIKLGMTLELLKGKFDTASLFDGSLIYQKGSTSDYNVYGHAEYRNQTRNKKWDIEGYGRLYLQGVDVGDYNAYISLRRLISRSIGYFQGGFENVNRTPSFVFNRASAFYYDTTKSTLSKENTTHIFASLDRPQNILSVTGSYYLLSNYTYITNYSRVRQASALFNLLEINIKKQFTLYRHWKWRTNTILQQVAGSSPVHVPLLVSFNQIGYDGNFGFKNFFCSFGTEVRYISSYKADGYSPLTGQWYSQGDSTVRQRLPDISAYLHFRVRSFTAYVRVEGLNAMAFSPNGFGFYKNNFVAPDYPSPGMVIRFGFIWGFIN